jgi:uncharacterized cofD-like protein
VAIGGGTGLSALLRGLKAYAPHQASAHAEPALKPAVDITAVVTVTDDGGSSGRLRRQLGALPPGDIRNCIVALSEDEALLSRLFQHRFSAGRDLRGHNFGNLFLTALSQVTGDFAQAVAMSSEILASRGRIFPSTAANVVLEARLEDGTVVAGESRISRSRRPIQRVTLKPRKCKPLPATLVAISRADLICLGPGSLFTSVIPNLLVEGIPEAIRRSRARCAYFVNMMWQPGETVNFRASDHVDAIARHALPGLVDYAIVNTTPLTPTMRRRYARELLYPVENDLPRLAELGVQVVGGDVLDKKSMDSRAVVRHAPAKAAAIAVALAAESRNHRQRAIAGD